MNINEIDIKALKYHNKIMYCKAEIIDKDFKTITMLEGNITSGNYSINSDSDIRRTCNITMCLQNGGSDFSEDILFNHYIRLYIGYYSFISDKILYYSMGIYSFDRESFRYDASSREVSFSLLDLCSLMDSNHYGTEYGSQTPCIPATDPDTGKRYTEPDRIVLKNIVTGLIKDFGITRYRIDDIGIHDRKDTAEYRWNELPYDLEFSADSSLLDKLVQIRDLYGTYEFFFDADGNFIFQEIPCTDDDMVTLPDDIVKDLVISENTDINIFDIKNVIEVWGKSHSFESSSDDNGNYQVHAVAIMTNGKIFQYYGGEAECRQHFSARYNTDNIVFVVDKDSKYCIEKIGEIRKSFTGNNYANLDTDSIAADYARAKLNMLCRRTASLNLDMIIVPWLDVNKKIQYKRQKSSETKTYITKSISGDLLSGTMSVSLIDFYATLDTE